MSTKSDEMDDSSEYEDLNYSIESELPLPELSPKFVSYFNNRCICDGCTDIMNNMALCQYCCESIGKEKQP